jgi:cytochrome P450
MPSGDLAWLITRCEDARFVLSDSRFSKAALVWHDSPKARPGTLPPGLLLTTDPPEHTALRAPLSRAMSARRINRLRPRIVAVADELLDLLAARSPPVDLVTGFAAPLAMRVICELLGVPIADRDRFAAWAEIVLATDQHGNAEVDQAQSELFGYMAELLRARRADPGDDLLSALACGGPGTSDAGLVAPDAASKLGATLLVTGYETMVAAIGNAVLTLLIHFGGLPQRSDDPEAVRRILEELLRFATFGDAVRSRRAVAEVRIGEVTIAAGDVVLVSIASANRDADQFEHPDDFLPGRSANRHVSFGHGAHYCIGAGLARLELEVALERLSLRFPGLRLAVAPELVILRAGSAESPPETLPVRW